MGGTEQAAGLSRYLLNFEIMGVALSDLPAVLGRYLLSIEVSDVLDIALMVFALYKLLTLVQSRKAASLLKGLFVFFAVLLLSYLFHLNGIYYLMSRMVELGVLALIILFQPEIRRILEEMGSRRILAFFSHTENASVLEQTISQTVLACAEMSQSHTGALIVFEREILLDDMVRSGTVLDASVSSELLKNIFFVKAPMHDGAVIIRMGRVLGAGCMLPLSRNVNLSRDLGMRHRAGIGMSENSDAVVVIVSEETGSISVVVGGMLKRHLKPETLENLLRNELLPQEEDGTDKQKFNFANLLRPKKNGGN
jgi:diadenylate cyclase